MNLKSFSGHTVDLDLLPASPVVLDVGARGFDFTAEVLQLRPHARIVALDPDPEIEPALNCFECLALNCFEFLTMALVGDDRTHSRYASYSTGEGNMLTDLERYYDAKILTVPCTNIARLMAARHVKQWDLVKLDCEGSEFEILEAWPGPIATQLSVEFHDGAQPTIYDRAYFEKLFAHLFQWYRIVQHEAFKQGAWVGHWDSLLVLK